MPQVKSKYDPFFSKSMEYPAIARSLFKQCIPAHIQNLSDLDASARVDRTNTSTKLSKRHRDIVYEASMQDSTTLLICPEHQSGDDSTLPVRFLYYNADSIAPYLEAGEKIPIIINIVVYHGERSPYPDHNTLQAYYERRELGAQELTLRYHVKDLTVLSDLTLLLYGLCAPMLLLLKHGRDGNFEREPAAYREVFQACISAVGDEYIDVILAFATSLSDKEAGERMFKFIEEVLINKSDIIMTYGQVLKREGRVEGKREGMQQGILGVAGNLLRKKMDIPFIVDTTGLSREEVVHLQHQRAL
jgi:predicted transposase YdaD